MERKSIGKFQGDELYLEVSSYTNKRIFIGLNTKEEPYADITINLADMMLPSKHCVFMNGDISNDLRDFLQEKGIITDSLGMYQYNMGRYEMAVVDFGKLKELDPQGFKEYEKYKSNDLEL